MSREWYLDVKGNVKTYTLIEKFDILSKETGLTENHKELSDWFKSTLMSYVYSTDKSISDTGWAESERARTYVDDRYSWK